MLVDFRLDAREARAIEPSLKAADSPELDRRRQVRTRNDLRLYGGSTDELLHARRKGDGPRLIVTPNLDHWRLLARSKAFRRAYDAAAIVLNDSRFLMKTVFGRATMTLPGCELVLMMLSAARPGIKVFVIGCPDEVRSYLLQSRPDLQFDTVEPSMGFIFSRAERRSMVDHVAALQPDRIFVCVGAPRSEIFAHQLLRRLSHECDILCCGAGLQFASGLKRRAPRWMQGAGLEWLWRMSGERHTRLRYLLDAFYLLRQHRALATLVRHRRTKLGRVSLSRP